MYVYTYVRIQEKETLESQLSLVVGLKDEYSVYGIIETIEEPTTTTEEPTSSTETEQIRNQMTDKSSAVSTFAVCGATAFAVITAIFNQIDIQLSWQWYYVLARTRVCVQGGIERASIQYQY